ncbi:MAG: long-chain fatty acid--CoA ligase [Verrucomicrobia bacterium]|nr:long-chain fatty acid--CoA ligase [Verrucomicrobiota bacterium]
MLYERWRQIAQKHSNELALHDTTSNRRWTFTQLAAEAERWSSSFSLSGGTLKRELQPSVQFPQGNTAEFILAVLRAWRENKIICPLDLDQSAPSLASPPPGGVHLKTTSATTGAPRLIAFTGEQLAADADNIVATMGLRADWPNLGVISLAHSYGFSNLVLPLLLHGIPLILTDGAMPETVRRAAKDFESITLAAVPALWRAWHDAKAIPSNVRLAISAGAPLPLPLEQAVFEVGELKIHNFYGSSECGGIAYDATNIPRTDGACTGAPMQNVQLSVGDDGCLQVRSEAVGQTYWPEPNADLANGCFRTSDLAEISGGLVYLRGRAGDQINVAGRKVSPETIERALLKHPQILECVVFGVPSRNAQRTEEIVAVIVSREREENLRQFALETLPAWQAPRQWWFVEAVQTNPRGKVSRADWR